MGGNQTWPASNRVMPSQQTHATFVVKSKPYRLTGAGARRDRKKKENSQAISLKLKQNLLSNFYSILSDHAPPTCPVDKQDDDHNETVNNINELKIEVLNGTILSAFTDSGATSNVGTTKDRDRRAFIATGRQSDKAFRMPDGLVEEATALDALQHNLRAPARDIHIVSSIERNLLLSVSKFVDANYIVI